MSIPTVQFKIKSEDLVLENDLIIRNNEMGSLRNIKHVFIEARFEKETFSLTNVHWREYCLSRQK